MIENEKQDKVDGVEQDRSETLEDLPPSQEPKGGMPIMANAHEMKKALIGNFPR